jgi:hypothetical protein
MLWIDPPFGSLSARKILASSGSKALNEDQLENLAKSLAQEDSQSLILDATWGEVPTPALLQLAGKARAMLEGLGQKWQAQNSYLSEVIAQRASKYRRASETLMVREIDQAEQRLAFEVLVSDDSNSYDSHRRFERKSSLSNVAHLAILALFSIGEIPLNMVSLEALGTVASNDAVRLGLSMALGVTVLGLAHFSGLYCKRLVTEHAELNSVAAKGPKFVRTVVVALLLGVGVVSIFFLASLRESELKQRQIESINTAKSLIERSQSKPTDNTSFASASIGDSLNAKNVATLIKAQSVLCTEATGGVTPSICVPDANSKTQYALKKHPFRSVSRALLVVQLGMLLIAFAIAFKSHDEILQQAKGQFEHFKRAERVANRARRRFARAEHRLSGALVVRSSLFQQASTNVDRIIANYQGAHSLYLRVVQGEQASPEASSIPPLKVDKPEWLSLDTSFPDFQISYRDADLSAMSFLPSRLIDGGSGDKAGDPSDVPDPSTIKSSRYFGLRIPYQLLVYRPETQQAGNPDRKKLIPRLFPARRNTNHAEEVLNV